MYTFQDFIRNLPRPPTKAERERSEEIRNPIKLITALSGMQWLLFLSGYLAWMMDAIDFFGVSLTANRLGATFGRSTHDITTAITLTLLLRSAGAVIFGLISDRYGRKWPLVANLIIVAALELATGFVNNFTEFLAVRSLFGIGMGGIWGMSVATALENMPVACRGFFSGILQQGYAVGYLIAAVLNLTIVQDKNDWRWLFYLGAILSLFAACFRACLPESELFLRAKEQGQVGGKGKTFLHEGKEALKLYWVRAIFCVILMAFFNFFSHGSQDLYPVFMENAKGFGAHDASIATIIGNCGAVTGGFIFGYLSQYLGRRIAIILACVIAGCFIPLWILPYGFSPLSAGAFFVQVGVQGAWAVIPIYLSELSPPAFRAFFPGLAYQLGNMISSASAQIEATVGESVRTTFRGRNVPAYGKIQGGLVGVVALCIILCCIVGPEQHSSDFAGADVKTAAQAGGGGAAPQPSRRLSANDIETGEKREKSEKGQSEYRETSE